jgi:signal transduction histidine kinase
MRRIGNLSLRTKLVGLFLGTTLAIVLLYGFLAYSAAREGLEDELGKRLTSVGQAISAELSGGFEAEQIRRLDADKTRVRDRLRQRLRRVKEQTGVKRMYLFDSDLENLVDTDGPTAFGEPIYKLEADRYEIRRTLDRAVATTSVLFEGQDGRLYKSAYVPITLGSEDAEADGPEVVAVLGVEASAEYFGLLRYFASVLTIIGGVGLALVVLVGTWFSRAITRPINQLVEAARRLGEGEFEEPVVEDNQLPDGETADEIAFLAHSFEEMRRDIRGRDRRMRMMLSGIAHEVRNPLGGMKLFCGLLEEDLDAREGAGDEFDEEREKLDRIRREVSYLERVVDEFRDFARQAPLERQRVDARRLVVDTVGTARGDLGEFGCDLTHEIEDGLELTVDPDRLRRVLLNLIRNAGQACGEGGRIVVRASAPEADRRVIEVEDDGPGMSPEVLEEVFTPFHTTKEKGSGLGLPLSKQIVEQHGGSIDVESEPGEGTLVRVSLPFDESIDERSSDVPEGWLG